MKETTPQDILSACEFLRNDHDNLPTESIVMELWHIKRERKEISAKISIRDAHILDAEILNLERNLDIRECCEDARKGKVIL